jgi:hypothetical protein
MLSGADDKCLRVWRTNDFTCVRVTNDIDFDIDSHSICLMDTLPLGLIGVELLEFGICLILTVLIC